MEPCSLTPFSLAPTPKPQDFYPIPLQSAEFGIEEIANHAEHQMEAPRHSAVNAKNAVSGRNHQPQEVKIQDQANMQKQPKIA